MAEQFNEGDRIKPFGSPYIYELKHGKYKSSRPEDGEYKEHFGYYVETKDRGHSYCYPFDPKLEWVKVV